MIKRLTVIIVLATLFVAFLPASAGAQIVTVEFSKQKDTKTGLIIYHLVFKQGEVIIAKRSYRNGETILEEGKIPDGMVVENYKDGKVKNIIFYQNGKRNGPAISLYESGRIKTQSYYKDGMLEGKAYYFFESGAIKAESKIVHGKQLYHYEYTETGKRGRYRTSNGKDVVEQR
jgi:antitoxin component YwqK of YwqJK toxin-antitoxin module